jgi:hypothetical protein
MKWGRFAHHSWFPVTGVLRSAERAADPSEGGRSERREMRAQWRPAAVRGARALVCSCITRLARHTHGYKTKGGNYYTNRFISVKDV